ncbi:hypothetical protein KM043_001182 [Ampulex compressa]|nr:hypothetical protein KM043_001182 [Ampulex compressa]
MMQLFRLYWDFLRFWEIAERAAAEQFELHEDTPNFLISLSRCRSTYPPSSCAQRVRTADNAFQISLYGLAYDTAHFKNDRTPGVALSSLSWRRDAAVKGTPEPLPPRCSEVDNGISFELVESNLKLISRGSSRDWCLRGRRLTRDAEARVESVEGCAEGEMTNEEGKQRVRHIVRFVDRRARKRDPSGKFGS